MSEFQKFIEEPKTVLEVKVNLERAINDLRSYYTKRFTDSFYEQGCERSQEFYNSMHAMEAMHNIKLTLK